MPGNPMQVTFVPRTAELFPKARHSRKLHSAVDGE